MINTWQNGAFCVLPSKPTTEEIESAVTGYLTENPPSGATEEQSAQIEQNAADIAALQTGLSDASGIQKGSIVPEQTTFIAGETSRNLFNRNTANIGCYMSAGEGSVKSNASYFYSANITVTPGEVYAWNRCDQIVYFDADNVYLGGIDGAGVKYGVASAEANTDYVHTHAAHYTIPDGVCYVVINGEISHLDDIQFEKGAESTAYTSYHSVMYLDIASKREANAPAAILSALILNDTATKIALIGDSMTQGQGSTGYVTYSIVENGTTYSVRGNGPDYPDAGDDYQIGDYLWESDTRRWYEALDGGGWAQLLKAYLESKFHCSVKNFGMSGIDSGNLSSFVENLTDGYDIVFLMIGANDRSNNTLRQLHDNLLETVELLLDAKKYVVLLSEIPVSISNETESSRRYHMEDVEHVYSLLSAETGVTHIPLYQEFLDYCDGKDITVDALLYDGLHPNDAGYEVLFRIICKHIGLSAKRDGATW